MMIIDYKMRNCGINKKMECKMDGIVEEIIEEIKNKLFPNQFINVSDLKLIAVEENIVLWEIINVLPQRQYFYTDLNGKLLFGCTFSSATPFSNFCAEVYFDENCPTTSKYNNISSGHMLLNIDKKERVIIPSEIRWYNQIRPICNNQIVVFDKDLKHWGSFQYFEDEAIFKPDIPFIWDALQFSRTKDYAYVGIHRIYRPIDNHPYGDGTGKLTFELPLKGLGKGALYDTELYFKLLNDFFHHWDEFRAITDQLPPSKKVYNTSEFEIQAIIDKNIREKWDIRDFYFEECYKYDYNNEQFVDAGNLDDYKKVYAKLLK